MSIQLSDEDLVQQIKQKVAELNNAVDHAKKRGLKTELDIDGFHNVVFKRSVKILT